MDRKKNKVCNSGNRWSAITYRLALAVYYRCSAAYRALCQFDILKLPSVYCVQQKLREYVDEPGINHEYMSKQRARYTEFKTQVKHQGKKEPLREGILIFDEAKIIDKVIWNLKSESFIGLAMLEEDFVQIKERDAWTKLNVKPAKIF